MTTRIRNNYYEMACDYEGKHATGREIYTLAADNVHSSWIPEYEGDDTEDLPVTDPDYEPDDDQNDNDDVVYAVIIESPGNIRKILFETYDYSEALNTYDAYGGDKGFLDENGFLWDLFIEEG